MAAFNKLQMRLMWPFLLLFITVNIVSLLLSRYIIARLVNERMTSQMARVSVILSGAEFVLSPPYLDKLKQVLGGDILVYATSGEMLISTLTSEQRSDFAKLVQVGKMAAKLSAESGNFYRQELTWGSEPYLLTAQLVPISELTQGQAVMCFLSPLSDVINAWSEINGYMFAIGLSGALLVAGIGYVIARSVARPIENMVDVTEDIARGNFQKEAAAPAISELKRLALSINSMTDRLRKSQDQIVRSSQWATTGKVTAAVAHELGNPLSSIKMMTQLLQQRTGVSPEDEAIVCALLDEVIRLEKTVRALSDLTRFSQLKLAEESLNAVVLEVLALLEAKLQHRKINVETSLQSDLPLLKMDKDKFKQVLWNLLLNAMDSMPDGGAIKVASRRIDSPGRVELVVEDQGCGIAVQDIDCVFQPFFSTKPEGLGLGLITSREIIEGHGGSLVIENRAEGGVRAIAALPLG